MFIFLLILFVCILLLPSCARADEAPAAHQRRSLQSLHDAFSSAANSQYAYSIAHRLATDLHLHNNATYGGRQAGSDAEHAAADYLADEMRRIGLSDVEKAAAKCDKWQFNGASFTVNGTEYTLQSVSPTWYYDTNDECGNTGSGKKKSAEYMDRMFKNCVIAPAEVRNQGMAYFDEQEDLKGPEALIKAIETFLRE